MSLASSPQQNINMKPNLYLWQVSLKSGGYGGESFITEETERQMLNCDRDF